jgi:hypothetical protein
LYKVGIEIIGKIKFKIFKIFGAPVISIILGLFFLPFMCCAKCCAKKCCNGS